MLFRKLAFITLDKLRGEITYEYEANGQLRSRNTGSITTSESFRYDPAANQLDLIQVLSIKDLILLMGRG